MRGEEEGKVGRGGEEKSGRGRGNVKRKEELEDM